MSKPPTQFFHLRYRLVGMPEGFTEKEKEKGWGACDAALLAAITYPHSDQPLSVSFVARDGRSFDDPLPDADWFKVWALMAHHLGSSETLPREKKALCAEVFSIISEGLTKPHPAPTGDGEGEGG